MTFEREFMAALCLGIVWVNTGLIVLHGWGDFRRLASWRRRFAGDVRDFTAAPGAGPTLRIVQAGRTKGDGAIHFHDRRSESLLSGGGLATSRVATSPGGELDVAGASEGIWVWPTREQIRAQLRCPSQADFDALARPALHARGAERIAEVALGRRCYVVGGYVEGGVLRGDRERPLIFSAEDPRAQLLRLELQVVGVLLAIVMTAVLLTALCFVGPAFGTVSQLAALGLFAYFLLVQPIGVWLSESVRWPHEAIHEGSWVRDQAPAQPAYGPSTAAS